MMRLSVLAVFAALVGSPAFAEDIYAGVGPSTYCAWNRTGLPVRQQQICHDRDIQIAKRDDATCCSERALEYRKLMMPMQRALDLGHRAGICQLRSEQYFRTLSDGIVIFAMKEARRIGVTNEEMSAADRAAHQILAQEARDNGTTDILQTCDRLRRDPRLMQLDNLQRELTGNYH